MRIKYSSQPEFVDNVKVDGFVMIGSGSTAVKTKKLTGITGAAEGNATNIVHGLPSISKIIGLQVLVTSPGNGNRIPPSFSYTAEHEYDVYIDATYVRVQLSATNSGSILNGAITALLTYEE